LGLPTPGAINALYIDSDGFDYDSVELLSMGYRLDPAPIASFGTPESAKYFAAESLGVVTKVAPMVYHPHAKTGLTKGIPPINLGFPMLVLNPIQPANRSTAAAGFQASMFGQPSIAGTVSAEATGFATGLVGLPKLRLGLAAQSVPLEVFFGTPTTGSLFKAQGFKATSIPKHSLVRTQIAATTYRPTRWGVARVERSDTYRCWPINQRTKFGRPQGFQRFNFPAESFSHTSFGEHTSFETHLASMQAPTTRLGRPLLRRTPLC
jgi:hypothetical protein